MRLEAEDLGRPGPPGGARPADKGGLLIGGPAPFIGVPGADMLSSGTKLERTRRFALLLGGDTLKSIDDKERGGPRLGSGVADGKGLL